jgi:hypothetical protein
MAEDSEDDPLLQNEAQKAINAKLSGKFNLCFISTRLLPGDLDRPSPMFRKIQEMNSILISVLSFEPDAVIARSDQASLMQKTAHQLIQGEEVINETPLISQRK